MGFELVGAIDRPDANLVLALREWLEGELAVTGTDIALGSLEFAPRLGDDFQVYVKAMGVVAKTLLGMVVVGDVITDFNLLIRRHDRHYVIDRHVRELTLYGSLEMARRIEYFLEIGGVGIFTGNDRLRKKRRSSETQR